MNFIKQAPIKYKLILMIMLTTISALLIAGIAFVIIDQNTVRKTMTERLETLSKVIADRSTAAIIFGDQESALQMVSALKQDTSVLAACTYTLPHELFAFYKRSEAITCPEKIQQHGVVFEGNYLLLTQSIFLKQKSIGTLHIIASLNEIKERFLWFSLIALIIILITSIVAFYLSRKLQDYITKPLLKLKDTTEYISNNADYSQQLQRGEDDEIGALYRSFSKMIEHIRTRELARDVAEKALRDNEHNLAITLDSIGDAVIATDATGNVTRMNKVAEQLTGWLLKEALGKNLKNVFPILNADSRQPIANPIEKVMSTGEIVYLSNHTTLISKDGTEYQIADSAAPIRDKNGNILGMVLAFNDVTEQYQLREAASKSKRDLQAIMDHSPAVIYVKDTEGRYTFANQQFEKLFHIQREDLIGKTDHDILPLDTANEVQRNDKAVLAVGRSLELEEIVPHDDGPHTYVSIKFPLINEKGNIYSICGISTDITERKQQEVQLRRSQKMDALGKLTGGIAHDYNNMLGVILGYSELLENQLTDQPKLADYVSQILHASKRGAELTKKLLAFTRHKSTQSDIFDINTLLLNEKHLLEKTLTVRIKLVLGLMDNLWPVRLDSGDLEDAVINMSINAMHAIKGNGQLTIQTSNEVINKMDAQRLNLIQGDYVLLSITDTGYGMNEETKGKIFDPFFSTKGEKGTGLGLSQVYGFVERSNGAIKVYSEPGNGTKLVLYFPRCFENIFETSSRNENISNVLNGTETILVADDEPALLNLTSEILEGKGYHVICVENGKQALDILATEPVDLLLSDIIMPEMDGYHLAAIVQKKYPNMKIQLASGFADSYHADIVDDKLKHQLIHKPYTSLTLLKRIRELLDG